MPDPAGAASCPRSCTARGCCCGSPAPAGATTWGTPRRFPTSRSWPPRSSGPSGATAWWGTGTSSGHSTTGGGNPGPPPARAGGGGGGGGPPPLGGAWPGLWTPDFWGGSPGPPGGRVGGAVQRLCARLPQRAFCFSRLHARRLREEGYRGEPVVLEGEYAGPLEPGPVRPAEQVVVFAGRQIPEKRAPLAVLATERARRELPELRCEVYGDGPDRPEVERLLAETGVGEAPGFVEPERIEYALARALCMLLPSSREGYGMVVIEAATKGTPSVLVAGSDNAAVELIEEGRYGFVAASPDPDELAAAIVRVHEGGQALRDSTSEWFRENAERLSLERSLERVVESYS